jgi:hypothetical protein
MRAVVAEIDPRLEIYQGWTIKHVLAHIAGWDDAVIASLRAHLGGQEPGTPAAQGIDFYNAQSVATREALDLEHVIREWELSRDTLTSMVAEMPEAKFQEEFLFPWGERGTVPYLVAIFVHHEREHVGEIRQVMAGGPGLARHD